MKILKRSLIAFIAIALLVLLGVYIYLQTTKPVYSGSVTLKGLHEEVEVLYDDYGVPHIYAKSAEDAYFALGYVHAQDRLFQMEMVRRAAAGRLSEVLGKDLLPVDKLFRTMGLNQFAEEHTKKFLSADTAAFQKATLAYQKGVNEYIRVGKTPIEFSIIGIPKTPFVPEDIYRVVGIMAFGFAEGIQADPVLEKIRMERGDAYLKDLAIQTPANAVKIKSFQGQAEKSPVDPLIAAVSSAIKNMPIPLWSGSNGLVIAGNRTASGLPILENDTHMEFSQPAVWYEAHMEYPGFRFYGHHAAGSPFGFLGNNGFCGVGLTMFENDDTDFFKEELNPENSNQVRFAGQWEDLKIREEVIKVKGEADVILTVKSSRHGPIMNALLDEATPVESPVSLWWGLQHHDNYSLQVIYELTHASRFEQVQRAASMLSAPGLNFMYGDTDGNIAWWAVAKLPIRPAHVNAKLFLDGASGKDEYLGYYDFSKNPQAVNPPWGFVYSANNQPDSVDGVLYPGYYYPRSRAGRLFELLSEDKVWTVDEVKKLTLDITSRMHPLIAEHLVNALIAANNPAYVEIIQALKTWNGEHGVNDIAPSIYYNLLSQTMYLAMADELGQKAYDAIMGTSIPKNSYEILIGNEFSPWWDDVRTPEKMETRSEIVAKAADRSIALLKANAGATMQEWKWGRIHTLTHGHPLGVVKPLDKIFNVGPFAAPGGSEVINNLHYKLDTSGYFRVNGGPALRKITDFGDIENGVTVSPTGQSGNRMSPYYSNQATMYVNGEFRKMLMNREAIQRSSQQLLLKPEN